MYNKYNKLDTYNKMNDDQKRFLVILIFCGLIIGCITTFVAINHQQKSDDQIVSNTIHMLNTTNGEVDPYFKENYNNVKHKVGMFDYSTNLSSSNMMIGDWNNLAEYIKNKYSNYDAFIIIVNNNTIVYTACAISFMIENLSKPIIFTEGNDLTTTLVLASQTKIPEVMISANNTLYRAVRNVFELTNENCLTYNYQTPNIKYANPKLIIPIIKVFPGIDEKYMKSFVDNKNIHGIILELWDEGSAPTNDGFLKSLKQITSKGVVILCVSKCNDINCELDIRLLDAGCLDGGDMTTEAAYAKLAFLLSNIPDKKMIGKLMEISFRGELIQK